MIVHRQRDKDEGEDSDMDRHSLLGVAYVDRKMEEELKKQGKKRDFAQGTGFFKMFYEKITRLYLMSQKYTHCELVFMEGEEDSDNVTAYGVFSDEGLFKKQRTLSNPAYRCIFLRITTPEFKRVKKYCDAQVTLNQQYGNPFDDSGMRWSTVWPMEMTPQKGWWCTSFVVSALQQIDILKGYSPNAMDTDSLIEILQGHKRTVNGLTPYRSRVNLPSALSIVIGPLDVIYGNYNHS